METKLHLFFVAMMISIFGGCVYFTELRLLVAVDCALFDKAFLCSHTACLSNGEKKRLILLKEYVEE